MLSYGKKVNSWLAIAHGEGRRRKYSKSAVERYRKLLDWFLFAGIFAVVIFSPSLPQRTYVIEYLETLSYLLVAVATVGRVWCGIYIFGHKSKVLCQDGPYSICRNPLYLFSFLGAMGVVIASNRILVIIGFASISCFYYFLVVKSEEKRLAQLFGRKYENYCSTVPRFRPNFRSYWSRERVETNPHLVFRSIVKNTWFFWLLCALEIIKALKEFPD
jgi:protein-S-isoprenylcysteine O-methyltransferase Ste14